MDIFQELEEAAGVPRGYMENFLKEVEDMILEEDAQENRYNVPILSNKWFNRPTQKDVAIIWDQCNFSSRACESMIESGLWEWATLHGHLVKKEDGYYVHWKSSTTKYSAKWSAFYRWFLCTLGSPVHYSL